MSLMKILGIGLATVGTLGAIGGITAAVITKQNATTSLNTVNSSEDKTTLVNKQEDKKMVDDKEKFSEKNTSIKDENTHQKDQPDVMVHANKDTGPSLKDENPKSITPKLKDEVNKEFGECATAKQMDSKQAGYGTNGIPIHCQVL